MPRAWNRALVVGAVVSAVGLVGCDRASAPAEGGKGELVAGKYLVVQGDSGHWVYEKTGDGALKLVAEKTSAAGMRQIWDVQSAYKPTTLEVGSGPTAESLLMVPGVGYSTASGQFQVIYRWYRMSNGKLVEVPMESLPTPAAPAAAPTPGR